MATDTAAHADSAAATTAPRPGGRGHMAALRAIERNTLEVALPGLGPVTLGSPGRLAWFAGLTAIAALGMIDWPVAAVLALGHLLAEDHHHRLLRDFGKALEEA